MKKLLIILLILPFLVVAQSKQQPTKKLAQKKTQLPINNLPKISGIGLFKLGDPKQKILDSIIFITGNQIIEIESENYVTENKLKGIFKYKNKYSFCEEQYLITSFNMQGIELKNIKIKFYNDVLYFFECDKSSDLEDVLNLKYGEAVFVHETKIIYCQNQYSGAEIEHETDDYTHTWRDDKQVLCCSTLHTYYNDDCEKLYLHYFILENLIYSESCRKCQVNQSENEKKKKWNNLDKF